MAHTYRTESVTGVTRRALDESINASVAEGERVVSASFDWLPSGYVVMLLIESKAKDPRTVCEKCGKQVNEFHEPGVSLSCRPKRTP
jgi:hypothetical protein